MVEVHRIFVNTVVVLLFIQTNSHAKKSFKPDVQCPIGFQVAYSKEKAEPLCYRLKGPESFRDTFKDCAGNLFTTKLYYSYDIPPIEETLWTEYKNLYPGGPFVDWSYTESSGSVLLTSSEVDTKRYTPSESETLCVTIDPISNFTAFSCDDHFYRYCFVKPYSDVVSKGCEEFVGSSRFSSPLPTCLVTVKPVGGGHVRATWRQAEELCEKLGGSLLNKGWRYANHPFFDARMNGSYPWYPLNIVFDHGDNMLRLNADGVTTEIDTSEWNFATNDFSSDKEFTTDMTLGAVHNPFWYLVNSSYIFFDVLCEKPVPLKNVSLTLEVDEENKIVLSTSELVDHTKIQCFTDSASYFPEPIIFAYDMILNVYILSPKDDGYYWCFYSDTQNYRISESNKALFIREKQSLMYVYSVKLTISDEYEFDHLERLYKSWKKKLSEYIYYRTEYTKQYGEFHDPTNIERTLKSFKSSIPKVNLKDREVIRSAKIRRLYLDGTTMLVHAAVNKEMMPVPPGSWDDLKVTFMKPVYYCNETDTIPTKPLGSSVITTGCVNYTCIGDFNEGVQWLISKAVDCTPPEYPRSVTSTVKLHSDVSMIMPTVGTMIPDIPTREFAPLEAEDSSEENTERHHSPEKSTTPGPPITVSFTDSPPDPVLTETPAINHTKPSRPTTTTTPLPPDNTTTEPPTTDRPTRPPPENQLQQVLEDLETLLNDTEPVLLENIERAFDQVDELLSDAEELEIPSELLHLLDGIGSRLVLNGTDPAVAVRDNIALLAANADPEVPVKGLRISARDTDTFTDGAFEIMRDSINSSHLQSGESEVVVQLPTSVANSQRRISFVVFRTDRAFQSSSHSRVNSRVLSIKVEDFDGFDTGEVIDIHLSPMRDAPERNQSRACAFWQFLDNSTGFWSQEGCTFIPSTEEGVLDTCRCDHLTHFAEILIPRTSFPEVHEAALELISIIGCCMSIIGLLLVGLTAVMFRSWRRDFSNKIWLQLCLAILILVSCFLVVAFVDFTEYNVICMLIGVLLHYSTLASFCWMLVAAILSYRRLVIVFTRDASHKLLKASAFSWGAPCAVVGILLSISPQTYAGQFEGEVPQGAFCYPSGLSLWLAVYAPIAVMLVANWTLFVLIVRSVFASRRIQRHGDSNEALRCASVSCLLVFLFGLPWVFGLFLASNIVTVYLFTITVTFQGFVLFVFFVLGNKKTRDLWLNKLKIKQTRKVPVTSSTYTNRSTGNPGWRGASGNTSSMEAKASKPRSLASPDESRFS